MYLPASVLQTANDRKVATVSLSRKLPRNHFFYTKNIDCGPFNCAILLLSTTESSAF